MNSDLNAADVAAALQGKIAGVTSLMPIGPNHLLYAIDPSKVTGPSAPGKNTISFHMQATDANGQIALASISLAVLPKASPPAIITPVLPAAIVNAAYKEKLLAVHIPGVKWKLKEVPVNEPGLKVDPNDGTVHFTPSQAGTIQFTVEAQGAAGGKSVSQEITVDVLDQSAGLRITSSQLQDAIAGVPYTASVEAIGGAGKVTWSSPDKPAGVVVDPAGNVIIVKPSPQAAPAAKVTAATVEAQLLELLGELPPVPLSPPEVLNLSNGSVGACAIITMIGHQVDGVASLAAISDTRIMARFTGNSDQVDQARSRLMKLIDGLAISTVPPAPHVQSVTMRLYYDRNAASVATAVGAAFSQLKVSPVSMNPANTYTDMIVLADPTGGTSPETLTQARRMIAQLDEPRAQVIVNAWSLQISSDKQNKTSELVPQARRLAGGYNDALESAVMRGWKYVNQTNLVAQGATSNPIDLDPVFSGYLCNSAKFGSSGTWTTLAFNPRCRFGYPAPQETDRLHFALGYNSLFGTEPPDLIQMLILVMATNHPGVVIDETVNRMEGLGESRGGSEPWMLTTKALGSGIESCQETDKRFYQRVRDEFKVETPGSGDSSDGPLIKNAKKQAAPPYIPFACTREKLNELTRAGKPGEVYSTSAIGQFRAAVADYLFQNKMKAEYPNDFQPFLYPQSAATLDAVLTPIVGAFNQDLEALQQNLQRQLTEGVRQDKHLYYTSNGLISVKVVSGNQAMAQTQSLNYFPQNPTMKLEDFAKALAAGETSTSTVPLLAGTLSSVVSAIGAYSAAKPAQVTAKVGSGLALTVTPYTLSSARGAELNVNVTYNENAAATISSDATQSQANDDLNSRVSEHEVSTLVRMDSLKFFEISTMQSVIARQKARYKLIDPVVELPILDGLAFGARRKPEVIYNQSIIFLEASIMPTAADLGQGLVFPYDRIELGAYSGRAQHVSEKAEPCGETVEQERNKLCIEAHNEADFLHDKLPYESVINAIFDYHKRMIAYFAGEYIDSTGVVQHQAGVSLPESLGQDVSSDAQ